MESTRTSDRRLADQLLSLCCNPPPEENVSQEVSFRIGLTGPPGAGKSTFIEAFALYLIQKQAQQVAVLVGFPKQSKTWERR